MEASKEQAFSKQIMTDPAVFESLVINALVLVLTAGMSYLAAVFRVLGRAVRFHDELPAGDLLVCGHRLVDGQPSVDYLVRLVRAAQLIEQYPDRRILLLGGGVPSEAAAGRDWLVKEWRIPLRKIVLEETSTNSFENLRNARRILGTDSKCTVITNRYHLARIALYADQIGLDVRLVAAETRFIPGLRTLGIVLLESAYICLFVTGRLWAQIAGRRQMLARIQE